MDQNNKPDGVPAKLKISYTGETIVGKLMSHPEGAFFAISEDGNRGYSLPGKYQRLWSDIGMHVTLL